MIMGVTMWVQMKLNPSPPDPTQKMIFDWMPLIFTFMLAGFSAGLVIYWAWSNTLSIAQQYMIMRRHGTPIGGGKPKPPAAIPAPAPAASNGGSAKKGGKGSGKKG